MLPLHGARRTGRRNVRMEAQIERMGNRTLRWTVGTKFAEIQLFA